MVSFACDVECSRETKNNLMGDDDATKHPTEETASEILASSDEERGKGSRRRAATPGEKQEGRGVASEIREGEGKEVQACR